MWSVKVITVFTISIDALDTDMSHSSNISLLSEAEGATLDAKVCDQSLRITNDIWLPYLRKAICDGALTRCGVEFDQECLDMVETICGLVSE